MNDLLAGFNPLEVQPASGGGGSLPVSDSKGHLVVIESAEWKQMADQSSGQRLVFTLRVTEGPMAGQSGFYGLNLGHLKSAEAVNIARSDLSAICHCCGWLQPLAQPNAADLYNRPFRVVVGLQKGEQAASKGYTEVKKILDSQGNPAGRQQPTGGGNVPQSSPAPQNAPAVNTMASIANSIDSSTKAEPSSTATATPGWARPPQ